MLAPPGEQSMSAEGRPRLERSLCLQHQLQFGQLHETRSLVSAGPRAPLWVGAAAQTPWRPCLQTTRQSVWAIAIPLQPSVSHLAPPILDGRL